jgi:membrane fusion protein (multidrug efflux system)
MRIPISGLALLLLYTIGCGSKNEGADKAAAGGAPGGQAAPSAARTAFAVSSIEGYIVKASALRENITASGTIVAAEETELHPEASGRVVRINLPEGRRVRRGELLVKIYDADLQTQRQKLLTQLKQAEITEQRLSELLKIKGVSQQEYDIQVLQAQNLRQEIELVRINIGKTELRAPYDGIIGLRRISPGAYVSPATAVASIRSAGGFKLDFSVPEKYGALLRTGQEVQFAVQGNPEPYKAVVQATEQRIESETRNLLVRALVRGNAAGLLPGQFAEVSLSLGENPRALLIPSQAIIPQARDKKVIVSRGGKAAFVTVKTGVRQAEMVEITEGLQAGDTIATTGMLFLRPDMPVKFSKVE